MNADWEGYRLAARRKKIAELVEIMAMALTDDEMFVLVNSIASSDPQTAWAGISTIIGPEAGRPFVRTRLIFKDAPFATYASLLALMIARDWSKGGAWTDEEVAKYMEMLGLGGEPGAFKGIEKETSSVEGFSTKIKEYAWKAVAALGRPVLRGVGGYFFGEKGAMIGDAIGSWAFGSGSYAPELPVGKVPANRQLPPLQGWG